MSGRILTPAEVEALAALETTPGPWEIDAIAEWDEWWWAAASVGPAAIGVANERDWPPPDAHLISATPDLLATALDLQARLASHEEDARRRIDALAAAERALDEARAEVAALRATLTPPAEP